MTRSVLRQLRQAAKSCTMESAYQQPWALLVVSSRCRQASRHARHHRAEAMESAYYDPASAPAWRNDVRVTLPRAAAAQWRPA
jgi:hypothetical protein